MSPQRSKVKARYIDIRMMLTQKNEQVRTSLIGSLRKKTSISPDRDMLEEK